MKTVTTPNSRSKTVGEVTRLETIEIVARGKSFVTLTRRKTFKNGQI